MFVFIALFHTTIIDDEEIAFNEPMKSLPLSTLRIISKTRLSFSLKRPVFVGPTNWWG